MRTPLRLVLGLVLIAHAAGATAADAVQVSVLSLENRSPGLAEDWFGSAAADTLTVALSRNARIQISERVNTDELNREAALSTTGVASTPRAQAANIVVNGWFTSEADKLTILIQVTQRNTSTVLWSKTLTGTLKNGTALCRQAASEMLTTLTGESAASPSAGESAAPPPAAAAMSYYRGKRARERGEDARALAEFLHALEKSPDFVDAWNELGATLEALHRPGMAVAAYRHAVALDPDSPSSAGTLYRIAFQAERAGDQRKACEIYLQIMTEYPFSLSPLTVAAPPDPNLPRNRIQQPAAQVQAPWAALANQRYQQLQTAPPPQPPQPGRPAVKQPPVEKK